MGTCIKVNSSGSWANLLPMVHPAKFGEALAACEVLALATRGDITFKVIKDGSDFAIFHKYPRKGEPHGWYEPQSPSEELRPAADRLALTAFPGNEVVMIDDRAVAELYAGLNATAVKMQDGTEQLVNEAAEVIRWRIFERTGLSVPIV